MPILLKILGSIPEELLQLITESSTPGIKQLSPAHRAFLKKLNEQLTEYINTIITYFPSQKLNLPHILAEVISPKEYDDVEAAVTKLHASNWLDSSKVTSALRPIYLAFLKRKHVKENQTPSLPAELQKLEYAQDAEAKNYGNKLEKEIIEINAMLSAASVIKDTQNLAQIFENIPDDLLQRTDETPIPKLAELTEEEKNTLLKFGTELSLFVQKIPSYLSISGNADSIMMVLAEVVKAPEFAPLQVKIEKLFKTQWLGVHAASASLTVLFTAFMLGNEINQKKQRSLLESIVDVETEQKDITKPNKNILAIQANIAKVQELLNTASIIQHMETLPSESKAKPGEQVITDFEAKLKNKIASLDEEMRDKDRAEENYELYVSNKNSKRTHLNKMLKQIQLYRFNVISLDELIERTDSFREVAQHFTHTSSFKIFANKHFDDLFTVDTKEMLEDFCKDLVKAQRKTQ
jgi:hypothetical protein